MQTRDNKTTVQHFLQSLFHEDEEVARWAVDPDFRYHDASTGRLNGLDDVERLFANFHRRYPDLRINVEHLADAEEDQVVARYTMYGTHQGDDKQVEAEGISISRIYDGRIQEIRVIWDTAGWMLQEMGRSNIVWHCWWWWCLESPETTESLPRTRSDA